MVVIEIKAIDEALAAAVLKLGHDVHTGLLQPPRLEAVVPVAACAVETPAPPLWQ